MRYKVKNWSEYNKSLIRRGSIELWYQDNLEELWYEKEPSASVGRPRTYSKLAMQIGFTVKTIYKLTYRATQGFLNSLKILAGWSFSIPSYTQLQRRAAQEAFSFIPPPRSKQGGLVLVVDSTGLKVYGEGEWKVRTHGWGKRRTWKKLHLGIDPQSHEVSTFLLSDASVHDGSAFPKLLEQVTTPLQRCLADSAYDMKSCYQACASRKIRFICPPRRNAVAETFGKETPCLALRNKAIRAIQSEKTSAPYAKNWKISSGYHQRSLVETAMFRLKTLIGRQLFSRLDATQKNEITIKINILNKMTALGMPLSIPVPS